MLMQETGKVKNKLTAKAQSTLQRRAGAEKRRGKLLDRIRRRKKLETGNKEKLETWKSSKCKAKKEKA